jgi:uncharacterized membrane protein
MNDGSRPANLAMLVASGAAVAIMVATSAWGWSQIPDDAQIPIHWGLDGQADGFAPKAVGLFALPALGLIISALLAIVPAIEPRRENLNRSAPAYRAVWLSLLGLLVVLHGAAVVAATGAGVDMAGLVAAGIGAMFVVIGNVLGKVRSNFMFGIRTPWTLTSDRSWNRTHRLGGRLMVALGLVVIGATALGLRGEPLFAIVGGGGGTLVVGVVVYSYLAWRADPDRRSGRPTT